MPICDCRLINNLPNQIFIGRDENPRRGLCELSIFECRLWIEWNSHQPSPRLWQAGKRHYQNAVRSTKSKRENFIDKLLGNRQAQSAFGNPKSPIPQSSLPLRHFDFRFRIYDDGCRAAPSVVDWGNSHQPSPRLWPAGKRHYQNAARSTKSTRDIRLVKLLITARQNRKSEIGHRGRSPTSFNPQSIHSIVTSSTSTGISTSSSLTKVALMLLVG